MRSGIIGPRGRAFLIIVGLLSLVFSVYLAGYNLSLLEKLTERFFWLFPFLDSTLSINTTSPSYLFERWLIAAVITTVVLNLVFYVMNIKTMNTILRESGKEQTQLVDFALYFIPLASVVIGSVIPMGFVYYYTTHSNSVDSLKIATGILLILFVCYDFFLMFVGKIVSTKTASAAGEEARLSLMRIDLPIAIAYLIFFFYTKYGFEIDIVSKAYDGIAGAAAQQGSKYASLSLNAFVAGAAAFKLLISNILFTAFMFEMLISAGAGDEQAR